MSVDLVGEKGAWDSAPKSRTGLRAQDLCQVHRAAKGRPGLGARLRVLRKVKLALLHAGSPHQSAGD